MSPRQENPLDLFQSLITLNIGGDIYSTSTNTFQKTHDGRNFLNKLQTFPFDGHGRIFIDRDGKYFRLILNYFRDGQVHLPEKIDELKEFFREAKFYQIDRLMTEIENRLNGENETSMKRKDGFHYTVLSNVELKKILGPLAIVQLFELGPLARRFLHLISTQFPLEKIDCQMAFPKDDRSIVCHPSDQLQRFVLAKQAKRFGFTVSYNEDFIYLPLESAAMSHQQLVEHLRDVYHGERLSQTMSNEDRATLVEHWFLRH